MFSIKGERIEIGRYLMQKHPVDVFGERLSEPCEDATCRAIIIQYKQNKTNASRSLSLVSVAGPAGGHDDRLQMDIIRRGAAGISRAGVVANDDGKMRTRILI